MNPQAPSWAFPACSDVFRVTIPFSYSVPVTQDPPAPLRPMVEVQQAHHSIYYPIYNHNPYYQNQPLTQIFDNPPANIPLPLWQSFKNAASAQLDSNFGPYFTYKAHNRYGVCFIALT